MGAPIVVSGKFVADFNFYCDRAGIVGPEIQRLRDAVRADFDKMGTWVSEMAEEYRFIDRTWGYMPTPQLCEGYLASLRWWAEDESIFKRCGILLLARLCAQVAGVIPGPDRTAQPSADPGAA